MENLEKVLSSFILDSNLKVPSFDELKSYLQIIEKRKQIELIVNGKAKMEEKSFLLS